MPKLQFIITARIVNASTIAERLHEAVPRVAKGKPNLAGAAVSDTFSRICDENPFDASWGNNAKSLIARHVYLDAVRDILDEEKGKSVAKGLAKVKAALEELAMDLEEAGVEYVDLEN